MMTSCDVVPMGGKDALMCGVDGSIDFDFVLQLIIEPIAGHNVTRGTCMLETGTSKATEHNTCHHEQQPFLIGVGRNTF